MERKVRTEESMKDVVHWIILLSEGKKEEKSER
jgi:hypothetical protein